MSTGSHGETQLENEHFRVTHWSIAPGGAIPMHRHEYEYVVVPLMSGTMHVVNADGTEVLTHLREGESYTRAPGAEHRIENRGGAVTVAFVEVEKLS